MLRDGLSSSHRVLGREVLYDSDLVLSSGDRSPTRGGAGCDPVLDHGEGSSTMWVLVLCGFCIVLSYGAENFRSLEVLPQLIIGFNPDRDYSLGW